MIMLSVEDNTIGAEKFFLMIFACLQIAIEELDVSTVAVTLDIVICDPVVENRSLL